MCMFMLVGLVHIVHAQKTNALNSIVPSEIIDSRARLHKSVGGIEASVHVSMVTGVKNLDACSDADYGKLDIDITWYNANNETGKVLLNMMKQLNAVDQDMQHFLAGVENGKSEEFIKGTLIWSGTSVACVNEISGPTGKTSYATKAKYFAFFGNRMIKISMDAGLKPETIKKVLSTIVTGIEKFDFSMYSSTIADEE